MAKKYVKFEYAKSKLEADAGRRFMIEDAFSKVKEETEFTKSLRIAYQRYNNITNKQFFALLKVIKFQKFQLINNKNSRYAPYEMKEETREAIGEPKVQKVILRKKVEK